MNVGSYFMKHRWILYKPFMWEFMNALLTHPSSKVLPRYIKNNKVLDMSSKVSHVMVGGGVDDKRQNGSPNAMLCTSHDMSIISAQSTTQLPLRCVYCQKFHPHKKNYIIQSWPFAELFEIPLQGAIRAPPCPGVMRRDSVGFIPRLQWIFRATPLVFH